MNVQPRTARTAGPAVVTREPVPPLPEGAREAPAATQAPTEEAEWIRAAQAGDRSAFARLVERYWDRLYRWLYHLTRDRHAAEDLTQETFLRALAAMKSFRPGSNFRAWVFRIGHNNFVNQKRSEKRTKHQLPDDAAADELNTAEVSLESQEVERIVMAAVNELPSDFKAALLLHVQQGMAYREVAEVLKTTEETARWRVFKARQKLMKILPPELLPPGVGTDPKE
jgi:RNA polymerase sigma-70 factor (ECF subfamily)